MKLKPCSAFSFLLGICRPKRRVIVFSKNHFQVPGYLWRKPKLSSSGVIGEGPRVRHSCGGLCVTSVPCVPGAPGTQEEGPLVALYSLTLHWGGAFWKSAPSTLHLLGPTPCLVWGQLSPLSGRPLDINRPKRQRRGRVHNSLTGYS